MYCELIKLLSHKIYFIILIMSEDFELDWSRRVEISTRVLMSQNYFSQLESRVEIKSWTRVLT